MSEAYFSPWFRRQLRLRDWSQAVFVRRTGVSSGTVSQWATGRRRPDPASCDLIAEAFAVPLDEVLRVAGHRPADERSPDDEYKDRLKVLIDGIPVSMLGPVLPMLQGLYDDAQRSRLRVVETRRHGRGTRDPATAEGRRARVPSG
jgi:transcriptional regulator with XRE-family HTH domain